MVKSPRKGSEALAAGGDSDSWVKGKQNQIRVFELFLAQATPHEQELWGLRWDQVPELYAADEDLYNKFGAFLVRERERLRD